MLMKTADISNESRPLKVAQGWVDCLLAEFFNQVSPCVFSLVFFSRTIILGTKGRSRKTQRPASVAAHGPRQSFAKRFPSDFYISYTATISQIDCAIVPEVKRESLHLL